jgi:hypothetical protein
MYTSQEGELYLGQARALGAIGVLPKQIRPADVTQVLHQLHLVEEAGPDDPTQLAAAMTGITTLTQPALAEPPPPEYAVEAPDTAAVAASLATSLGSANAATGRFAVATGDTLLRDQIAELRRALFARIEEQHDNLPGMIRDALRAELPPPPPPAPVFAPPPARGGRAAAVVLGVLALLFALLWWRALIDRAKLEDRLAALPLAAAPPQSTDAAGTVAAPADVAAPPAGAAPAPVTRPARLPASPVSFAVPYGEAPLSGERVAAVRGVLEELRRGGLRGDVEIQVYQGRFCVVGNAAEGYSLAPDELPPTRCDRIGNPAQDGGSARESLPFANMLAEQRKAAAQAFTIRSGDGTDRPQPYPEPAGSTAGQWNVVAAANNRVELRWRERP